MAAAARYFIHTKSTGFTNNSGSGLRLISSGKLTSPSTTVASAIVTVPDAPKDEELFLNLSSSYTDAVANTGGGSFWFVISEPGVPPNTSQVEKAVEDAPRLLLSTAARGGNVSMIVRPGQRFVIIDTGFAS